MRFLAREQALFQPRKRAAPEVRWGSLTVIGTRRTCRFFHWNLTNVCSAANAPFGRVSPSAEGTLYGGDAPTFAPEQSWEGTYAYQLRAGRSVLPCHTMKLVERGSTDCFGAGLTVTRPSQIFAVQGLLLRIL